MLERSKGFTNMENKYKYSSEYEIKTLALASLIQAISARDMPDLMHNVIMLLGAKVGIDSDGVLNPMEKNLIDYIMGDIFGEGMSRIYDMLSQPVNEKDYFLVDRIARLGVDVSIPFLNYILCFAYIDGYINDITAANLDDIFNIVFIDDIIN